MILNLFVIWSFSPFHGPFQFILFLSLQYFTVLPTEIFCRYVIKSLSVIYFYRHPYRQNTSICNTTIHRYIGQQHKKNICRWFYKQKLCAKKKNFPLEIYRWIYPVVDSVIYRRIHIIGKVVGECLKYRSKISVCTFISHCGRYCQIPTD
jgi:hypothetical protein